MKKIIINSDDFGISEAYNLGVIQAFLHGGISSTTLIINADYTDQAISLANENPKLGLGLHLTLTSFKSLTKHPAISEDGYLKSQDYYHNNSNIDQYAIEAELRAQIELFIKKLRHKPTHFDMHHHLHQIEPISKIVLMLAEEYQIPARGFTTSSGKSKCNIDFYGEGVSYKQLVKSTEELLKDNYDYRELCCHVGFLDQYLMDISSYNLQRIIEYKIICSVKYQKFLENNKIELVTY